MGLIAFNDRTSIQHGDSYRQRLTKRRSPSLAADVGVRLDRHLHRDI
jgi:hypothetical protein